MSNTLEIPESLARYKEGKLDHSYILLQLVRQTKTSIESIMYKDGAGAVYEYYVKDIFRRLENLGKIYDSLVLKSQNCISIYDGALIPKLLNPTFFELIESTEDELFRRLEEKVSPPNTMLSLYYEGANKVKVIRYTGKLTRGEIAGYKYVNFPITVPAMPSGISEEDLKNFERKILNRHWSNFILPDSKINIRFGIKPYDGIPGEEEIKSLDMSQVYTYSNFKNSVDKMGTDLYGRVKKMPDRIKEDIDKTFENYKIMATALDMLMKMSPIPAGIYQDAKPLILSDEFLRLSGYTMSEIMDYFNKHGEVTTLFYKGKHLEHVKNCLEQFKNSNDADGYSGVEFTMTSKTGDEITISWSTFLIEGGLDSTGKKLLFTARSGQVKNIVKADQVQ